MRRPTIQQIAAAGALALITALPLAACGHAHPLRPLPVEAAQPSGAPASPTWTAPPNTAAPRATPTPRPRTTRPASTCLGAVRYDLDLHDVLDLIRSMCFHTGGVLRLQGIGPGLVSATPTRLVSQNYEAGVVDLRFVNPGTVTVKIPQDERTYTITVVVIR